MKEVTLGRPQHAAYPEQPVRAPNAALLIDFDNVTMGIRSDLQNQLKRLLSSHIFKGKVSVQRAYADWRRYPQYIVPLSEASIDLIFAPAFGSNKKNATDIRLAIDALELVFTRPEIGTFILLSGDSDFSSLVLKLKEYAKYVIGVGIRESSSDLLIQNCDEYYSYNELTGLTKEGEIEVARRDPWELVVEAVVKMTQDDDVMRSDRLKQVMQGIDPNFDEKEAGFNRFSKFVQECGRRRLLTLEKLDNGQYAIGVGSDANVPPGEVAVAGKKQVEQPAAPGPARGSRRRTERRGAKREEPLALAEAFELLKQSLWILNAVGSEAAESQDVRRQMVELFGDDGDPIFEKFRFKRFLRQAHDADLIELIKSDNDRYLLKLNPAAAEADIEVQEETDKQPPVPAEEETEASPETPKRRRRTRTPSRKPGRGESRAKTDRGAAPEKSEEEAHEASAASTPAAKTPPRTSEAKTQEQSSQTLRNPRYRRGSRGPRETPSEPAASQENVESKAPEASASRSASGARGLGPRSGSRRRAPEPKRTDTDSQRPGDERATAREADASTHEAVQQAAAPPSSPAPEGAVDRPVSPPAPKDVDDDGLLRRMTAALHRMVGGPPTKPDDS